MNHSIRDFYRRILNRTFPWSFRQGPCILWAGELYYYDECRSDAQCLLRFLSQPSVKVLQ